MNRLPVFWVPTPGEDDAQDFERYIQVRIADDWLAVDSDQLIIPVMLLERDGETLDEPQRGVLKQYGGEGLLNDLLLADGDLEEGAEFLLGYQEGRGRYAEPL